MRDISKASFYKSWYECANNLQNEDRLKFYDIIFKYYFEGTEPEENTSFMLKNLFLVVKANIDADIKRRAGGAPKGNKNAIKEKQLKNNLLFLDKTNNVNVNEDVNEEEDVNDNDNDREVVPAKGKVLENPTEYSKKVFTLLKNAGLPCAKENEISFFMTDFSNALRFLHNSEEYAHIHSDDVIGAVSNYIQVLEDPESWVDARMNFFQLVKSKFFYNLLPANFDEDYYKDKEKVKAAEKERENVPEPHIYIEGATCPKCGKHRIWHSNKLKTYICEDCFNLMKELPNEL